jgi:AraC family transcriptional regulator, regulatory protein of adaptative response / DNA-3-methyladenine glycosylase II
MFDHLARRAIAGVEQAQDGVYQRTFDIAGATGRISVRSAGDGGLDVRLETETLGVLSAALARVRAVFDLDVDIGAVQKVLAADPFLAPLVAARTGLRAPGGWEPFELAVRAILGQQVSVSAAATFAARLAERYGQALDYGEGPNRLFPKPEALVDLDAGAVGLTKARAGALRALAERVLREPFFLEPTGDLQHKIEVLRSVPGVGPWTAQYIALRALRDPDAFPSGDIVLRKALGGVETEEAEARSQDWRPWRAYAAEHLWRSV